MPTFTAIPPERFLEAVEQLATQLRKDSWRPTLLVGVGRGGLVPAVFLSHATGLPMVSIDFSTPIPEFNDALVGVLAARSAGGERLVFVEDINDSGRTIAALRRGLAEAGAAMENIRFAVLIDNRVSAERVEYAHNVIDRTVNKDWFVFPWEAVAPRAALEEDAADIPERIA
jgi:uncharacterized protein